MLIKKNKKLELIYASFLGEIKIKDDKFIVKVKGDDGKYKTVLIRSLKEDESDKTAKNFYLHIDKELNKKYGFNLNHKEKADTSDRINAIFDECSKKEKVLEEVKANALKNAEFLKKSKIFDDKEAGVIKETFDILTERKEKKKEKNQQKEV